MRCRLMRYLGGTGCTKDETQVVKPALAENLREIPGT